MAVSVIPKELVGEAYNISSFQNGWTVNGGCFYQRIGNLGIICCSIRNGTTTDGIKILSMPTNMKPASNSLAPCINASGGAVNGYVLIDTDSQVTLNKVSSNASVVFTLMYRCA